MTTTITDVPQLSRYELRLDGELISFADYRIDGDVYMVPHVETLPAHRDRGNAERLLAGVTEHMRSFGRQIVPLCSFAAAYFRDHPEERDIIADS